MNIENKLLNYYETESKELGISIDEIKNNLIESWGSCRGYGIFSDDVSDALHIERVDEMFIYDTDLDASIQAEKDGIKIIHDIDIPKDSILYYYKDTFVDTEDNREILLNELSMF